MCCCADAVKARYFIVRSLSGPCLAALLAACAGNKPIDPVVDLSSRQCANQPDLSNPQALSMQDRASLTQVIDNSAPCVLLADGSKSLYRVFSLPDTTTPGMVSVTSTPVGQGLFTPRVVLLDAAGTVLRELPRDMFMFHGSALYAAARLHAGDHFLLVASDPQTAGQTVSQIVGSTQANTATAATVSGTVSFTIHTGREATNLYTYAHSGSVTVAVKPIPGEGNTGH